MERAAEGLAGGVGADRGEISGFKRIRATICEHCPVCIHARKSPDSTIGKILHHRYHADHCPLWTAYRDVHGRNGDSETDSSRKSMES